MKLLGDPIEHYWMVTDMAARTQTGLVAAYQDGRLTQQDWADMVHRCRGCDWASECRAWLDEGVPMDKAPTPCLNRDKLATLKEARVR